MLPITCSGKIRYTLSAIDAAFKDSTSIKIPMKEPLKISLITRGYEPLVNDFLPSTDSLEIIDTLFLLPLKVDSVFNFSQIYFEGNTATFLPGSEIALTALVDLMNINPGLKIEIQGHVNGPRQKNTKEFKRLSEQRAKEIKSYLTDNQIKKNRIIAEGYGNTKMIFPEPKTPEEGEKNRRVEIKILKLD
jgi:outer membrane protein OmpA-like peptidoglycan-associated protein